MLMFPQGRCALLAGCALAAMTHAPSLAQSPDTPEVEASETILITGRQNAFGYRAETAASATKTITALEDVPQSIQVLTRDLLTDQDLRTLGEALQNVSGVGSISEQEGLLTTFLIRGFEADAYLDGLPVFGQTNVADPGSLINVQRVEVVKGPTATLFGGGTGAPVGGLINVVSKSVMDEQALLLGVRGGSQNTLNAYLDWNQPLVSNGRAGLRLTGEYLSADSHIDVVEQEKWSLYPTLFAQFGTETTLTLRGQISRNEYIEYAGLPAEGTIIEAPGGYSIQRDRFSGAEDQPKTTVDNTVLTGVLAHRFSAAVEGSLAVRWYESEFNELSSFQFGAGGAFDPDGAGPQVPLFNSRLPTEVEQLNINPNLAVSFDTGALRHNVLVGVEYDETDNFAQIAFGFAGSLDWSDPNATSPFGVAPDPASGLTQDNRYTTTGAYIQDQLAIGERVTLTGGLRWTDIDVEERASGAVAGDDRFTGRFGVTAEVTDGVTVFAGYGQGFEAVLNFTGVNGAPPEPSESESLEAGVKLNQPTLGLSGTLAVYQLIRTNVPASANDPNNPFAQVQTGEQESQGVELDVLWTATDTLSVLGTYAYTEAEVTKATDSFGAAVSAGDRLARVPEHSGRLALRYKFADWAELNGLLAPLAVGLGATYTGAQPLTLPNDVVLQDGSIAANVKTEAFTLLDAQAEYAWERVTARLSVTNLTDEDAFTPYPFLAGPFVQPVRPLSAFLTLETQF